MPSCFEINVVLAELDDVPKLSVGKDSFRKVCTEYQGVIAFVCTCMSAASIEVELAPFLKHELTTALVCIFTHALNQAKALPYQYFEKVEFQRQLFSAILMEGQGTAVFKSVKLDALIKVIGMLNAMVILNSL